MGLVNRESNRIAIEALSLAPEDTVLELGCGPGRTIATLARMAPQGHVFGIDHSPEMLARAECRNRRVARVQLLRSELDALPFRTGSIDKILAVHVVYFIDAEAMREANRVLRSGGSIAVLATDRRVMENREFVKAGKHRLFDRDDLVALLLAGGFAKHTIAVSAIKLRFGIPALLGIAKKS